MKKWQDFDLVTVITLPLFLFSATFFPITAYPTWLRTLVEITPLYRGVHMLREPDDRHRRRDDPHRRRLSHDRWA